MSSLTTVSAANLSPPDTRSRIGNGLRVAAQREGLSDAYLRDVIAPLNPGQGAALAFLMNGEGAAALGDIRRVLERLEDRLGVDLGSEAVVGRGTVVGRQVANVVGAIAGVLCGFVVLGGLAEGDSLLLGHSAGAAGLFLFIFVLSILGLFEALHTSATMLKIADVGALAYKYPRAAALHRHFRTNRGLARFLAGRQMVVIITVFICSPLSSFPGLKHWPLTSVALPGLLEPFIKFGMPGALFTLWFGQLVPQFIATRHAVRLTNARVVWFAFKMAYGLEAIGLARPGFWIAALNKGSDPIPQSAENRWTQDAKQLHGFGGVGYVREWEIGDGIAELRATSTTRVYDDGATSITDGSLLVPGTPIRMVLSAQAMRQDAVLPLAPSDHRDETLPSGDHRFHKPLISAIGSFRAGDALRLQLDADYSSDPARDVVHVDRPVRFVLFRIVPSAPVLAMPAATLRTFSVGDGLGDLTEVGQPVRIEPEYTGAGVPVLSHLVSFPRPNTLYVLDWEVDVDA